MLARTVVGAFALLLVTGCGADPEVREPKPEPSASATSTPPTMPAQAKEDSSEGDVAFVLHWIDVFNHAAASGDTRDLADLSAETCAGCANYIALFDKTYAAGGYFAGSEWRASDLEIERNSRRSLVYVHIKAPEGRFRSSSKVPEKAGDAEDSELVFEVRATKSGKTIHRLERSE